MSLPRGLTATPHRLGLALTERGDDLLARTASVGRKLNALRSGLRRSRTTDPAP